MTEPDITAELVLEHTDIPRDMAERIATYANSRATGARPIDAAREARVSEPTASRYEKFLRRLRNDLGLPQLPARMGASKSYGFTPERLRKASAANAHRRHLELGITRTGCEHCRESEAADG